MGRNKAIEDSVLIELIKEYWGKNCCGDQRKLKLTAITRYINENGYPDYAVESLRRNENARAYIDVLARDSRDTAQRVVAAYKTIDIDVFLDTHKTRASLKQALTELDGYYSLVSEAAAAVEKRYRNLEKEYAALLQEVKNLSDENLRLSQLEEPMKAEIKSLKEEKRALQSVVNDYVYPDIANELLVRMGVLTNVDSVIKVSGLDEMLITGDTVLDKNDKPVFGSNVIEGLFKILED